MGLDMYLYKKSYITFVPHIEVDLGLTPVKESSTRIAGRLRHVVHEVGYWRKANAIHKWFVDNIQEGMDDCREYYVDTNQMENLYEIVCEVLEKPDLAKELLPPANGFFFGSDEIDGYYFEDLSYTKKLLESIIEESKSDSEVYHDYYYCSSW